ncbi:RNA-directed DNA polymerase, eukaryota, partial [Tanacetum coccineum]
IAEDVYVTVGKFQFPADFVVVDFEPDPGVPLILGRSFLKTRHALIDVYEGEITLRVGREAITFNLDQTLRYTANYHHMTANRIDAIDMACEKYSQEVLGCSIKSVTICFPNISPISLIDSVYKIITKILANRLSLVISDLVSDVQSAFVSNRQILDGPFILNELISWCKNKNTKAMIFKIDFEKAFDSVRWDFLDMVLNNFGFGPKCRSWIQGCLNSATGSILVNGSPTSEFKFFKGLKQGDLLSPFLFILIMENDVVFVVKWNLSNLSTTVNVLKWVFLASGLKISLYKSKLMGIGISHDVVVLAARLIGCLTFHTPFNYLGVKVGGIMSRLSSWEDVVAKLTSRLSKWKLKALSIGGCLTLIKSVLSSLSLYYMSSFTVPKGVLCKMESTHRNFFNGVENSNKKLADSPLKQVYPWLYFLEANKQSSMATKLSDPSLTASFIMPLRGNIEEEQLQLLVAREEAAGINMIEGTKKQQYIFESMVKNLDNAGKFLMHPRFIQFFLDNHLEGMSSHKRIYVTPSHTKKIFANMRRQGKDFSRRETPLFPTKVVQAQEEMCEGSAMPTDPHHTPIITQPSSSQPQRKQKSKRPKEKDTQAPQLSVPSDPTNVADEAINEEPKNTKTAQAQEITSLKLRVKKLEKKKGSRTHKLKRLYRGRKIHDIDADEDITLENVHDAEMFDVNDLDGDEVVVKREVTDKAGEKRNIVEEAVVVTDAVTILVSAATITNVELTLAQTLAELKSARPKTKGVVMQEPSESTPTISLQLPSQVKGQGSKDKGKAKMIEPEKPLKKKDQIKFDEEEALRLQAKFDEEDRLAREKAQQVEEANIAWDDIQAKIDADYQLAERLQAQEQQELTIEEKSTLFVQLLEKRKKHFAVKRAEEKRNRPPTRAQQRSIMCTYLKNMAGWKPKDLKNKSFANIQELFDKAFKRVNTFVDFRT